MCNGVLIFRFHLGNNYSTLALQYYIVPATMFEKKVKFDNPLILHKSTPFERSHVFSIKTFYTVLYNFVRDLVNFL